MQPPKQPAKPRIARRPRDAAGKMELQGGTGPIKHMISFGDFMEVYKVDKTFRVRTPNSVDPSNTDANAPWIVQDTADTGCAHPIVARVVIQSRSFLREMMISRQIDVDAAMTVLHAAKEGLLSCEAAVRRLHSAVRSVVESVEARGLYWSKDARAINPFPHVQDLEAYSGDILVKANRQVRTICELAGCFVNLERRHSNFDHLFKELEAKLGPDAPLTVMVGECSQFVRHVAELRNFEEHKGDVRTVIHNFALGPAPDYALIAPSWEVVGKPEHPREDICRDSERMVGRLLELTEWTVIHGMMQWRNPRFGHYVAEVADERMDGECPIRYVPRANLQVPFGKPGDQVE